MSTFEQMKAGYGNMWASAKVDAAHEAVLRRIAQTIIDHRSDYAAAEKATGVPWYMIGALHYRESDLNFKTYLGNGDRLDRVSVHVPKGRGPFETWSAGAIDALKLQGFTKIHEWPIEQILYSSEVFNGTGYVLHHENSPYVWAGTNHQERGKYEADGVYNASMWDTQMGVAAIIKELMTLDSSIKLGKQESTTMTDTPTVVKPTNAGLVTVMQELDKITHLLQGIVTYVPKLAMLPVIGTPLKPLLPFVPAAEAILDALDKIEASNGDISAIFAEGQKVFPTIMAAIEQAKSGLKIG